MAHWVANAEATMRNAELRQSPGSVRQPVAHDVFQGPAQIGAESTQRLTVQLRRDCARGVDQLAPTAAIPQQMQTPLGVRKITERVQ